MNRPFYLRKIYLGLLIIFSATQIGYSQSQHPKYRLIILNFKQVPEEASSRFLSYELPQALEPGISKIRSLVTLEREQHADILEEIEYQYDRSELFDDNTRAKLKKQVGANVALVGKITKRGGEVRVDAKIVEIERGIRLASDYVVLGEMQLNKQSDIARRMDYLSMKLEESLKNIPPPAPEEKKYRLGEKSIYVLEYKQYYSKFDVARRYDLSNNPVARYLPGKGKRSDYDGYFGQGEKLDLLEERFHPDENCTYYKVLHPRTKAQYWISEHNTTEIDPRLYFDAKVKGTSFSGYIVLNAHELSKNEGYFLGSLKFLDFVDEAIGEMTINLADCMRVSFHGGKVSLYLLFPNDEIDFISGWIKDYHCYLVTPNTSNGVKLNQSELNLTLDRISSDGERVYSGDFEQWEKLRLKKYPEFEYNFNEILRGQLIDPRDGQTYQTIQFGKRIWMAQNLNFKASDSWCYNNDPIYCQEYGRLYAWEAAMSACPIGWRLPTKEEWQDMLDSFSPPFGSNKKKEAFRVLMKGGETAFDAQLGGSKARYVNGKNFGGIKNFGYFWSSSRNKYGDKNPINFSFVLRTKSIYEHDHNPETNGFSCRCVKE